MLPGSAAILASANSNADLVRLRVVLDDIAELKARRGSASKRDGCFRQTVADNLGGQLRHAAGLWAIEPGRLRFLALAE